MATPMPPKLPESAAAQPLLPVTPWQVGGKTWEFRRPMIMGVLNATPDSFSDGGDHFTLAAALERAHQLVGEGADLIDLGGASSHPRALPVSADEELHRIAPIVERLVQEVPLPLSIDTQQPTVADACLRAGAHLVNDVSGLPDEAMARVAARHGTPLVIMFNNLAEPRDPNLPLFEAMEAFFAERVGRAEAAGVEKIVLDPGYGFGKSLQENLELLRGLHRLKQQRRPLLVCTSRKGSLGRITGEGNPRNRLGGTLASSLYAVAQGAHMIRVHDVREFRQGLRTWEAIQHGREPA